MTVLNINGKEYKVKYGFNSFCDTDLLDRVSDIGKLLGGEEVENDNDVAGIGRIKDLFCVVRELLFVGFERFNPMSSLQEVGNLLDEYKEEETEEERGLLQLFTILSEELTNEGFLADILAINPEEKQVKKPQDRKKKVAKITTMK